MAEGTSSKCRGSKSVNTIPGTPNGNLVEDSKVAMSSLIEIQDTGKAGRWMATSNGLPGKSLSTAHGINSRRMRGK